MYIDDPTKFNIDPATVNMTLGEFTEEDSKLYATEAGEFLAQFQLINREELPVERQFSYDVLQHILTDMAEQPEYEYYYEPLTEYSGLQANLPLSFALFELKNTTDIEDYLKLLADMPRYLGQVLAYEQKRARAEHVYDGTRVGMRFWKTARRLSTRARYVVSLCNVQRRD